MITKYLWKIHKKLEILLVASGRKLDRGRRETFHYQPFGTFSFLYPMCYLPKQNEIQIAMSCLYSALHITECFQGCSFDHHSSQVSHHPTETDAHTCAPPGLHQDASAIFLVIFPIPSNLF